MLFYLPLLSALLPSITALNPIVIKGSKFFDSKTGEQFFMKGVAYQPREGGASDPLAIPENCARDAKLLKELGANVIRVYETYPWNNHDACMKSFEDAGIYLLLDLAIPDISINRKEPSYDTDVFVHHKQQIDAFYKYKNIIGFFAGNEVTNDEETTPASAHIKAILRDCKAYLKSKGVKIPVGYANNDDPKVRNHIQEYFNCGDDEEKADFYGINIYSWCGKSSFKTSGYDKRTKELESYSIPSILSEFGCNTVLPRQFGDITSLYNEDMNEVFSGGIIYEYTQEENKYGLVEIKGGKLKKLSDFNVVKEKFAAAKPKGTTLDDYVVKNKKDKCPKVDSTWKASNKLPPTPSEDACECIFKTLECQVNSKGEEPSNGQKIGKFLGEICGNGMCDKITSDTEEGVYGDFSTCNAKIRSSIAFSEAVKKGAKCSDFGGLTSTNKDATNKSAKDCAKLTPNLKDAPKPKKSSKDKTGNVKKANGGSDDDDDDDDDSSSSKKSKDDSKDSSSSLTTFYSILSIAFGFSFSLFN